MAKDLEGPDDEQEKKWRIEGDVRTLKEAEMIKSDPQRMKDAMALMDEEMQAMMKVHAMGSLEGKARKRFSTTYQEKGK